MSEEIILNRERKKLKKNQIKNSEYNDLFY